MKGKEDFLNNKDFFFKELHKKAVEHLLCAELEESTKKWTMPIHNWELF
ncbi:hypothetical protein J5U18_03345 [Sphingobacteriaceae bacterium WQ 2009]|uniref:Uncharacterized protein n=1 Tax=Rhinopithecimicrobium faecis TaxID=2820698 RepID=A0A8T4HAY5_9SPHI|nr:hypothetical protein [Sphingobacteriaceae bacterium WQ 2009]